MNEQAMRFRLGLFVLGMLMLLAVLILLFGGFPGILRKQIEYTTRFKDASGVAPGTPVRRSGVRIGEVKSLQLDDTSGQVQVAIVVDPQHPLRRDDAATVARGLLGGDTTVDIVQRPAAGQPPDRRPLPPGSQVPGLEPSNLHSLLNQASDLMPSTQQTLKDMRQTLKDYDQMTPLMQDTLREFHDLAQATRTMIPELRRTNDEIRDLAHATRETIPELRRTNNQIQLTARNWNQLGERLDTLLRTNQAKLVKALDNFNDAVVRVGQAFNDENQRNLATTLRHVRAGSERLDSISQNTDALIKESRQTIQRVNDSITRTDNVLTNLQQATRPLGERSDRVMRNLDEGAVKFNRLMDDFSQTLGGFNRGTGSFNRFLNDPALYNNLNDAACMLTHILPRMDYMMHDLQIFADKLARHPESLGLGGLIKPSSGLKEIPQSEPVWHQR